MIKKTYKKHIISPCLLLPLVFFLLLNSFRVWSQDDANSVSLAPSTERQSELIHLLKQDCGSCHGMTLQGGLGPSLLPAALADKADYIMVGTILYGRETLAMPAWDGILNKSEVEWLVAQLKEGIE